MPSKDELKELKSVLLAYAFKGKLTRQARAVAYVLDRLINEGPRCKFIQWQEIDSNCPSPRKEVDKPHQAVHRLIGDVRIVLASFYDGDSESQPQAVGLTTLRMFFDGKNRGNYVPSFEPYEGPQPKQDWWRLFWQPHLHPMGTATIVYPEPMFLRDEAGTYFRNPAMRTKADVSMLAYLSIKGELRPSYSYVPAGIVQGMLHISKKLRAHNTNQWNFAECEVIKPKTTSFSSEKDIIFLATPTSTDMVGIVQDHTRLKMLVEADGVHYEDLIRSDEEKTQWGVVTRTTQKSRVVTMLIANQGRSIEAMAEFITSDSQLALLAQLMGRKDAFPSSFQLLLKMPFAKTDEGPSVGNTFVDAWTEPDQVEKST